MTLTGVISKMPCRVDTDGKISYQLPIGSQLCVLNALVGQKIRLQYTGKISCVYCGMAIKKAYQQGYCFLATQKLARCDLCILKPELCHHHKGTCREPEWGTKHCMQPHYIYLANASAIKVGITREQNIPFRWVDQGASQALPILKVATRRIAGLIEIALGQYVSDKTNWRKMLKNDIELVDLAERRDHLLSQVWGKVKDIKTQFGAESIEKVNAEMLHLHYPVKQYPINITSFNFDKNPIVEGILMGIKGQYLIFDGGVINIRKFSGYEVALSSDVDVTAHGIELSKPATQCPFVK